MEVVDIANLESSSLDMFHQSCLGWRDVLQDSNVPVHGCLHADVTFENYCVPLNFI